MVKKKQTVAKRFEKAATFFDQLKLALEFHDEPAVLAAHSPLATPYFLSSAYQVDKADGPLSNVPVDWGEMLRDELDRAAAQLWKGVLPSDQATLMQTVAQEGQSGSSARYDFLMLELNYFKQIVRPRPRNQAEIYNDVLHISRATHDRYLREAVARLGEALLQRLHPTVRLESPTLHSALIGRSGLRAQALRALEQGQSVALVGVGGVGKTTLGTWLAEHWARDNLFWFTVRPHFNDRLPSLLFALGCFLHRQGASSLWLQLVADGGKVADANLALGLALADVEALPSAPLLCIDEVDLLRADDPERENPHHAQMLDFVRGLRGQAPLLLMGQRAPLQTEVTLALDRLSSEEMAQWLAHEQIAHAPEDLAKLAHYTGGNPRLLTLCLALHHALGQPALVETLLRLPQSPTLAPIWDRVSKRLAPSQRRLLHALSVFRDAVPRDAWRSSPLLKGVMEGVQTNGAASDDSITDLVRHHLVQQDSAGAVALLPTLRTLLYEDLSVERREALHLNAARICATRGEITEAAYHLWRGGKAEQAVKFWFPQRKREIERGFATGALDIFTQISANRLEPAQQRQLALLRAELYDFMGEPEKLVDNLAAVEWPRDAVESIDAMYMWGVGLHTQGNTNDAQKRLRIGIDIISHLFSKYTQLHVRRGTIYMHEREMKEAWAEANQARYHAEHLQGAIQDHLGNYEAAQKHHQTALLLAQKTGSRQACARTQYHLGILASRQQDFTTAFKYFEQARENYSSTGNQTQEMYVRSNQAACHILTAEYRESIVQAKEALSFYERANSPYWIALNACNLAEAHFELGDLTHAEEYAFKTIQQEETDTFAYGLWILARVRQAQGNPDAAIDLLTQAIQIAEENEDRWQVAYSRRTLGEVYAAMDDIEAAQRELSAALALFQQMEIAAEVEKTEGLLAGLE